MGKAEITTEYILERVAPYFNRHGYYATSMSDITSITGLTKGAIYGNFESKEHLALEAFRFNIKILLTKISIVIQKEENAIDQLLSMMTFYKSYLDFSESLGGCPILRVGMDSLDNNPLLRQKVKSVTLKMKKSIEDIILHGIECHEIKAFTDAGKWANIIYGTIEGGIFLSSILKDDQALHDNIDYLSQAIKELRT